MIEEPGTDWQRQQVLKGMARDRVWETETGNPITPIPPWVTRWKDAFLSEMRGAVDDGTARCIEIDARSAAQEFRENRTFPDDFFDEEYHIDTLQRVDELLGDISPVVRYTLEDDGEDWADYPNVEATIAAVQTAGALRRAEVSARATVIPGLESSHAQAPIPSTETPPALVVKWYRNDFWSTVFGWLIFIGLLLLAFTVLTFAAEHGSDGDGGIRCRDGTISHSGGGSGTCSWHGGIG